MSTAIEFDKVNKSFSEIFQKKKVILKDLTFQIEKEKVTGFIGVNGSGKTTTIKAMLGFIFPDSGNIRYFNSNFSVDVRKKIGFCPERPYVYDFLTGEEFLKLHWDLNNHTTENFQQRMKQVLESLELYSARSIRIQKYSKGMQQRIALAQALLNDPEVLILDEPMSGLDPDGRILVKQIIKEEKKKCKTIFFSSHLLQDMEQVCDRIVMIHQGSIIYQGDLVEFLSLAKSKYHVESLEDSFKKYRDDFFKKANS